MALIQGITLEIPQKLEIESAGTRVQVTFVFLVQGNP